MTIARSFFNWQTSGLDPNRQPWERCSPNLVELRRYLEGRWGGRYLGCHHDRPIRSGTTWSSHAYGSALDWRYQPAGDDQDRFHTYPGRSVVVNDVIPWLIDHSAELGIDAIHDYVTKRVWRAGRTSFVGDAHTSWWRTARISGGAWLHIETHRDTWHLNTPIDSRITTEPTRPADLFDISSWQTITRWADVPETPIVHRVITKGNEVDTRFASRMPVISQRTELFGGYVVVVGGIATAQMVNYVEQMRPFWRIGAFTQIDVEQWAGLPLVTLDELEACMTLHEQAFGPGRLLVYINPTTLPDLWAEWVARFPTVPRWIPGYRDTDDQKAERYDAVVWQWTDRYPASGFTGPIDANQIRHMDRLRQAAGLTPAEEDDNMPPYIKRYPKIGQFHPFTLAILADDDLAVGGPLHGLPVVDSDWKTDTQWHAVLHTNGPVVAGMLRERAAAAG